MNVTSNKKSELEKVQFAWPKNLSPEKKAWVLKYMAEMEEKYGSHFQHTKEHRDIYLKGVEAKMAELITQP